jgi:hypothetical protein
MAIVIHRQSTISRRFGYFHLFIVFSIIVTSYVHNYGMTATTSSSSSSSSNRDADLDLLIDLPTTTTKSSSTANIKQQQAMTTTNLTTVSTVRNLSSPSSLGAGAAADASTDASTGAATLVEHNANNSTPPTLLPSPILEECFPYNSHRWIQSPKYNNIDTIPQSDVEVMMEGPFEATKLYSLFNDYTICHKDSPLLSTIFSSGSSASKTADDNNNNNTNDDYAVEDWYFRYFYLAIHHQFHRPAYREYTKRKECYATNKKDELETFMKRHNIGTMDYECPDVKFVVSPIGNIGFGGYLNTLVAATVQLALKTGRVPVFTVTSHFSWHDFKTGHNPWMLSPLGCARHDLQCYFMPSTPCTLTLEDLQKAPIYGSTFKEQKFIASEMQIPKEMENDRVVVLNSGLQFKPTTPTSEIAQVTYNVVEELMTEWKQQQSRQEQAKEGKKIWTSSEWKLMEQAHNWILKKAKDDPGAILRQLYIYMLRPNPHYGKLLKEQMATIMTPDVNPKTTVGMAIRGSDKCKSESTCLPFEKYMDLATTLAYPTLKNLPAGGSGDDHRPRLILTTEDPEVFEQSLAYQTNASFPFHFLVNNQDNMQGSGYPREIQHNAENTMVSTLIAIQLQLSASKVYLNCCSNSHVVINYMIKGQCGAHRHGNANLYRHRDRTNLPAVAECLDTFDASTGYRICCGWSKKESPCLEIWEKHLSDNPGLRDRKFGSNKLKLRDE